VLGLDGTLDAYAWPDLELVDKVSVRTAGQDGNPRRDRATYLGTRDGDRLIAVDSAQKATILRLMSGSGRIG